MAFWWTGRGYLALLTVIGVYGGFGAILTVAFGEGVFEKLPWLWVVGALLSSAATWYVGSRINGRPWRLTRFTNIGQRLFYNAPNRFMSMPVETWAGVMILLGIFLLGRASVGSAG